MKNLKKTFGISEHDARNALTVCLLLCLAWAFCRGFYMPSTWSTNYWLISFFDGFGRRALLGTLLYPFGTLRHYYHFVASIQIVASVTLLALVLGRLAMWARKNASSSVYIYMFLCGFLLSKYGAFFFGTVGYADYPQYLLIFLAFLIPHNGIRILLATLTIWVHENAALTCLPLYFAVEYLYFRRKNTALATFATSLISFIIIYVFFRTASHGTIEDYKAGFLAQANYIPRVDYLDQVFSKGAAEFYFLTTTHYRYSMRHYAIFCLLLATMLAWLLSRSRALSWRSSILAWLCLVSPLALGFFGYDTNRWIFLTLVHISVLFILFQKHMDTRERIGFIATAFAIFFSSSVPLFHERHYRNIHEILPFVQNIKSFITSTPFR